MARITPRAAALAEQNKLIYQAGIEKGRDEAARKRPKVAAARGNLRMILNLSKNVDHNTDVIISDIITIARLARAALKDLGEPGF